MRPSVIHESRYGRRNKNNNYIRSHALQHRQVKEFFNELSSEYGDIVFFSNVRWLNHGKCLKSFLGLRKEIHMFMNEKKESVLELSDDD